MARQLKITAFFNSPGAPLSKPEAMVRLDSSDEENEQVKVHNIDDQNKRKLLTTSPRTTNPATKPVEPIISLDSDEDSDNVQKSRVKKAKNDTNKPSMTKPRPMKIKATPKRKRQYSDSDVESESSSAMSTGNGELILLSSSSDDSASCEEVPPSKTSRPKDVQDGIIGMKVRSPANKSDKA